MMKCFLFILVLTVAVKANAQTDLQHTPKGASYQVFTHNTGDKIKLNDVVTFEVIQKTEKDSVLFSTYTMGRPVKIQVQPSQNAGDLMDVLPLLAVKDSACVKVPTDSIFKGQENQRPAFLPKESNQVFLIKIDKIQSLDEAIAEKNAALEGLKTAEVTASNKYIADHKLVVKTTLSGLKYVITQPSLKKK